MSEAEEFLGLNASPTTERQSDVPLRRKVIMVISAWIAGLLIASPDPRGITMIALFPFGLMGFICAWLKIADTENAMLDHRENTRTCAGGRLPNTTVWRRCLSDSAAMISGGIGSFGPYVNCT